MESAQTSTVFVCTQCGGELHPDQGQIFITCPYCHSTVYLDKSQVAFHWVLAPTLDERKARAALARWMAGNQTVKDLDKKARLIGSTFRFFPMWYFKRRHPDGKETILLEPAAATSISELKRINLPAGDLQSFQEQLEKDAVAPTVPLQAAHRWLESRGVPLDQIAERALVHLPVYTYKYAYEGETYTALVEAATGQTFANIFPAKAEAPYRLVAGLTGVTFLLLATTPAIGGFFEDGEGVILGLMICAGLGVPLSLVFFAFAAWVAAKV